MTETPSSENISTRLQRIAELARRHRGEALTTLSHHIDVEFLREAWRRTRKDGAVGIDGQTASDYERELDQNLASLCERFHLGTYTAPPVRRVHIPKGGGKTRPIGIPTLEDKILQRAVAMVLEAIYEQDFVDCSYGFRPGRSAHQALDSLRDSLMAMNGGYVIDLDIQAFFDSLDQAELRGFLDQRVRDGTIRRAIHKWLKAGVVEDGAVSYPRHGTPQGGVVSPILANVFLHHVLDEWFDDVVRPRLRGQATLVRYADDAIIVCTLETDMKRLMQVLPRRLGRFGLTLHPEKTKVVVFRRPRLREAGCGRLARPGSFDFLGFTHYWGRSRKGNWVVRLKTASTRQTRTLRRINEWCRANRHLPIRDQSQALTRMLHGHYAYFGVTGNSRALNSLFIQVVRTWYRWLNRRSQRRDLYWDRFRRILQHHPLPSPRIVRSVFR